MIAASSCIGKMRFLRDLAAGERNPRREHLSSKNERKGFSSPSWVLISGIIQTRRPKTRHSAAISDAIFALFEKIRATHDETS